MENGGFRKNIGKQLTPFFFFWRLGGSFCHCEAIHVSLEMNSYNIWRKVSSHFDSSVPRMSPCWPPTSRGQGQHTSSNWVRSKVVSMGDLGHGTLHWSLFKWNQTWKKDWLFTNCQLSQSTEILWNTFQSECQNCTETKRRLNFPQYSSNFHYTFCWHRSLHVCHMCQDRGQQAKACRLLSRWYFGLSLSFSGEQHESSYMPSSFSKFATTYILEERPS